MLSAHDHRFSFWGMTVALNIDDSYPQQNRFDAKNFLAGVRLVNFGSSEDPEKAHDKVVCTVRKLVAKHIAENRSAARK